MPQQLAHATSNGASIRTGDLMASGTISGAERGSEGSLIELTWNGSEPIRVADGTRTFLEDGDEVVLRGEPLGEVRGRIAGSRPARLGRPRELHTAAALGVCRRGSQARYALLPNRIRHCSDAKGELRSFCFS